MERPGTGKVPAQQEHPGSMQVVLGSWFEKKGAGQYMPGKGTQRKLLFKDQAVVLLKNPQCDGK